MRTLNLGIVAHVDAGKTTLTERLLYNAGIINEIGRVDDGNTTTDTLALERQRGITIKSAVVSFAIGDVTVNLIDTPGHPDFIAEVERVLAVLDGAVLVVSAVEGVQPQTRILMRTLRRLGIPVVIFVNKTDRAGADPGRVERAIRDKLTPDAEYPVRFGSALTGTGVPELAEAITRFLPCSSGSADAPLDGVVFKIEHGAAGEKVAYIRIFDGTLRVRDRVHFGATGDSPLAPLMIVCGSQRISLTSTHDHEGGRGRRQAGGGGGGRNGGGAKVTAVEATSGERGTARAGQIARVRGLRDIRIGDAIRDARGPLSERKGSGGLFAPPTLETAVVPVSAADRVALHAALTLLAEADPLIGLRRDGEQMFVSLYGEVQKEVIEATLASDFGLAVEFEETTTICVERPLGTGESVERMKVGGNPFLATVGLRVSPRPASPGVSPRPGSPGVSPLPGSRDVEFRLGVSPGDMPPAFFAAVEETVHETLRQGLRGWQVTGAVVTMTHCGYAPRQSHAHQRFNKAMSSTGADFRGLTPLVTLAALAAARTAVYEPVHRFLLEIPSERIEPTLTALPRFAAIPLTTTPARGGGWVVEGEIPAARIRGLQQSLPGLTSGEGVLETSFDRYEGVRGGSVPSRARTGPDPLNRKEYLLRVTRRV